MMTFLNSLCLLVGVGVGVTIFYLGLRLGLILGQRAKEDMPLVDENNTIAEPYTGD
jgi:hypothetical protein